MRTANEPAFPSLRELVAPDTYKTLSDGGLTKREYFAAMAMQGFCHLYKHGRLSTTKEAAYESVLMADALIAELNMEQK